MRDVYPVLTDIDVTSRSTTLVATLFLHSSTLS